jgi:hypothetical protein
MQNEDWDMNRFEDSSNEFEQRIEEKDPEALMKYKNYFDD